MKKLLLLAFVALSMALVSCGGKATTPKDAVEKYMEAYEKMNPEEILATMFIEEDKVEEQMNLYEGIAKMKDLTKTEIIGYNITDEKEVEKDKRVLVTVSVKTKIRGNEIFQPMQLNVVNKGEELGWMVTY